MTDKKDSALDNSDLMDIFSAPIEKEENKKIMDEIQKEIELEKAEEKAPAVEKPKIVMRTKAEELFHMPPPVPQATKQEEKPAEGKKVEVSLNPPEVKVCEAVKTEPVGNKELSDLLMLFEETRRIMKNELVPGINEKTVNSMLEKTLEKTALNYPVLKGANWKSDGEISEDGSITIDAVMKNAAVCGGQAEEALSALFFSRLKSVKLGAGREKYEELKTVFLKKIAVIQAGYPAEVALSMKNNVTGPAFKKGDETS